MIYYFILSKIYGKYVTNLKNVKGVNKLIEILHAFIYPVSIRRRQEKKFKTKYDVNKDTGEDNNKLVQHVCGDVLRVKDFRIPLIFETAAYPNLYFGISIINKRHKMTK